MQNYELRCRKLTGEYVTARLGEFESLLDCLSDFDGLEMPGPLECEVWAVLSDDGMELAAKRG